MSTVPAFLTFPVLMRTSGRKDLPGFPVEGDCVHHDGEGMTAPILAEVVSVPGSGVGRQVAHTLLDEDTKSPVTLCQLIRSQAPQTPCSSKTAPPPGDHGEAHESVENISHSNLTNIFFHILPCVPPPET